MKQEPRRSPTAAESNQGSAEAEIRGRLKELKRDIALHRYEVDASVVAEAILSKLRLVRQGRLALGVTEADRILLALVAPRER